MSDNKQVEQIYYYDWSQELAPGHENYWHDIDLIATLIGARLSAPCEGWMPKRLHHTISVRQSKEKFGECRVYIALASSELAVEILKQDYENHISWSKSYKERKEANKLAGWEVDRDPTEWKHKEYFTVKQAEDTNFDYEKLSQLSSWEKYINYRYICDLMFYRSVYLEFKSLFPQYWKAISQGADHSEFLYETPEEFIEKTTGNWDNKKYYDEVKKEVFEVCRWEQEEKE